MKVPGMLARLRQVAKPRPSSIEETAVIELDFCTDR